MNDGSPTATGAHWVPSHVRITGERGHRAYLVCLRVIYALLAL